MHYRLHHLKGFILLHTLCLLLTLSLLVSSVLSISTKQAVEYSLALNEAKSLLAQESAIEQVLYDILNKERLSSWLKEAVVTKELSVEGSYVIISVQNTLGLVDVGIGNLDSLDQLLREQGDAGVIDKIIDIRERSGTAFRPFNGYSDFFSQSGISETSYHCLYPHITLFSSESKANPANASDRLKSILNIDTTTNKTLFTTQKASIAGSTYRIIAKVKGEVTSQPLSVEVTITGRLHPSHIVRSWELLILNPAVSCSLS